MTTAPGRPLLSRHIGLDAICGLALVACQGAPARGPTAPAASGSPGPVIESPAAAAREPSASATSQAAPLASTPPAPSSSSASAGTVDAGAHAPTAPLFVGTWVNKHAGDEVDLEIALQDGDLLIQAMVMPKPEPCDPMAPALANPCVDTGIARVVASMRGTVQGRSASVPATSVARNGGGLGILGGGVPDPNAKGGGTLTLLSDSQLRFTWTPPQECPAGASGAIYTRQPP